MVSRFLYYAFGGGMGHAMRTISLARQMARRGGTHVVVCNSPFAESIEQVARREPDIELVRVCSSLNPGQCRSKLRELHDSIRPGALIVDTFPRGLGGELAPLLDENEHELRVLVSRVLPRRYVSDFQLTEFVAQHYDLVIAPGEPFGVGPQMSDPFHPNATRFREVDPFLIRDAAELPSRAEAALRLSADPDRPVVLLVGSGNHDECSETAKLFTEIHAIIDQALPTVQCRLAMPVSLTDPTGTKSGGDAYSPLIELLPAVDFVVGSAGYNLYWETTALRIPSCLRARNRKYDCQYQRKIDAPETFSIPQLIDRIQNVSVREAAVPDFRNGASTAARLINQLCVSSV
jgi:hypothetical protein